MSTKDKFVGIDVSKDWLDFAVAGIAQIVRFGNHQAGIDELGSQTDRLQPKLIAVEVSGGYELAFVEALMRNAHQVAVVNPTQVGALVNARGL